MSSFFDGKRKPDSVAAGKKITGIIEPVNTARDRRVIIPVLKTILVKDAVYNSKPGIVIKNITLMDAALDGGA